MKATASIVNKSKYNKQTPEFYIITTVKNIFAQQIIKRKNTAQGYIPCAIKRIK